MKISDFTMRYNGCNIWLHSKDIINGGYIMISDMEGNQLTSLDQKCILCLYDSNDFCIDTTFYDSLHQMLKIELEKQSA